VDCNPGTWSSRGRVPGRDFDHAQSVNFRPNPTPRGGHSRWEHWHCVFGPGSPRPRHLFFMNNARRKSNRSGLSRSGRNALHSTALCLPAPQPRSGKIFRVRTSRGFESTSTSVHRSRQGAHRSSQSPELYGLQCTTATRTMLKALSRLCAFKFRFPVAHSRLLTRSAVERGARYVDFLRAEPSVGTDRGRAWIAVPADQ
jgi:hypothetical protein